jgi:hypothetical protein
MSVTITSILMSGLFFRQSSLTIVDCLFTHVVEVNCGHHKLGGTWNGFGVIENFKT